MTFKSRRYEDNASIGVAGAFIKHEPGLYGGVGALAHRVTGVILNGHGVPECLGMHVRGLRGGIGPRDHGVAGTILCGHGGGPRSNLGMRIGLLRTFE